MEFRLIHQGRVWAWQVMSPNQSHWTRKGYSSLGDQTYVFPKLQRGRTTDQRSTFSTLSPSCNRRGTHLTFRWNHASCWPWYLWEAQWSVWLHSATQIQGNKVQASMLGTNGSQGRYLCAQRTPSLSTLMYSSTPLLNDSFKALPSHHSLWRSQLVCLPWHPNPDQVRLGKVCRRSLSIVRTLKVRQLDQHQLTRWKLGVSDGQCLRKRYP